ncbi:cupin domain-containing protein [Pontibacillus sp. HMF3514]|uniref:cupin domain-containing protein n=1 Tax=Pontibacillus sp. HMF3514 TaxID=2692425 RepID=UPI00131F9589|nr:cupin [Pontibacillus sp. HMF3514]QHE53942.1 cupin [Pontibacillus sp. HMF3514]
MKFFRFDEKVAKSITQYDSTFSMSPLLLIEDGAHIGCMHIPEGGNVGEHEAACDQLFVVMEGEGWVYGEDGVTYPIQKGIAAFWVTGESHASGSETGMTVIAVESGKLKPEERMQEVTLQPQNI